MKKVLLTLALFGTFAAMTAKGDSFMYWMVDTTGNSQIGTQANYAELYAFYGNKPGTLVGGIDLVDGVWDARTISDSLVGMVGDGWSYYVEAYKDDWNIGTSDSITYANAKAMYDGIYESLKTGGKGTVEFTTFTYNIPEPTSGLLMLLGLCGLALKRKRT